MTTAVSKTPENLVELIEAVRQDVADVIVDQWDFLRDQFGPRPAFAVDLTREEIALRSLAEWLTLGQAHVSVSVPYYTMLATKWGLPGPPDWKAVAKFDMQLRRLYADPKYHGATWQAAEPELGQLFQRLIAMGLHTGAPQEPGSSADQGLLEPAFLHAPAAPATNGVLGKVA